MSTWALDRPHLSGESCRRQRLSHGRLAGGAANRLVLAMGSNAVAALCLIASLLVMDGTLPFAALALSPGMVVAYVVVAALMFALFFRLQVVGGPVYLSQIGYVAAATSAADRHLRTRRTLRAGHLDGRPGHRCRRCGDDSSIAARKVAQLR